MGATSFMQLEVRKKARALALAEGSREECRYFFILARDLGFADTAPYLQDAEEVSPTLQSYTGAVLASRFTPRAMLVALLSFFF
jgi:hypothetical protein